MLLMPKKDKYKPGDTIAVTTNDKQVTGLVMPSPDAQNIVLKLKSGYNIVINKRSITTVKKEKAVAAIEKQKPQKIEYKPGLKTVTILHTGGTISSEIDYQTGAVVPRFTPEEIIAKYPQLSEIANIRSRLIRNMFSEDMRFAHYNILAKEIQKEIKEGVDGIIITHGTDTIAYTAAALSFALEHLPIPVVLVGSQRSSDRGSSDAALNLLSAMRFITQSDFGEVAICMHETSSDESCVLLPGTKTRKMHASRRDAFKAVNARPFARITKEGKITWINQQYKKVDKSRKFALKLFKEDLKIGVLKIHPNMFAKEFESYATFNGLILEGTGLGHAPINVIDKETKEHAKMLKSIEKLAKKMPVVMTSQTLFGRINMNVYSTGRLLKEKGVLGDYADIPPETAFIKLAWVLSNYPKAQVATIMHEDVRSEITKRSAHEDFL